MYSFEVLQQLFEGPKILALLVTPSLKIKVDLNSLVPATFEVKIKSIE
jgi:hypothetical protein